MKNPLRAFPGLSRLILGALLLASALIGGSFIHLRFVPASLVLVILATVLMFRTEGKNLSAIGFTLNPRQLILLPLGLLLGSASFLLSLYAGTLVRGGALARNTALDWGGLFSRFQSELAPAAVQEFIVVGYCYLVLLRLTNIRVATVVFGMFFISLHDVWNGNVVNASFYALALFLAYMMFSNALLRSGTIWFPIGLHWGNNFANTHLFTFSRTATSWLYVSGPQQQNLSVGQAIGLFVALNIGVVTVIGITNLLWRDKRLPPAKSG